MPTSDALIVGEDWISEHYFTTDAKSESFQAKVTERRKAWDEDAKNGASSVRSRFTAARRELGSKIADLQASEPGTGVQRADDDALPGLYADLRKILGYDTGEYVLKQHGPVIRVSTPDLSEAAPLIIIEARAADAIEDLITKQSRTAKEAETLLTPYVVDEKTEILSVSRLLSELLTAADGPAFALVMAGRWLLVAERARWQEGRYLAVDLQLVCERNETKVGGEIDRALACVGAESLAPDAEGNIWWRAVLEDSINHTAAVSKELREGVRLSIEIIANDVVKRRREQGLDPLPKAQAQPLARQSLRFLYRILFLLYAEASPELEVLPVGAQEYDQGYGLDRLRELTLVELTGPRAINGTHLYDSLHRLFTLVDKGHEPPASANEAAESVDDSALDGLVFQPLRADLFLPKATALIDETKLCNAALQKVLRNLLLSKETRGKDRGFISYAELGINQLGAVYEGLMSYTGFFAEEDLYEVAKDGDPSKGSWVVPIERSHDIARKDFVTEQDEITGEDKPVIHRRGTFVYRLAGRERQQSASYYTPEVLTRFTVSQALAELLDQDGQRTKAEKILKLTVCEPALGSGAFAIEAVRQLAEQYLRRRQKETGKRIDPEQYPQELQRVKAYIALHQVYGVDLNDTAVEFAEITLWLDTMVSGLQAPWFGLRLRRGNSLIGARRAVYTRQQVNDKNWLTATPTDVPMTGMVEEMAVGTTARQTNGHIHHFLLPAKGWGSAVEVKEAKEAVALAAENVAALKKWRSAITAKPSKKQVDQLVELAHRVEALWQITLRRLEIAESEARRHIKLWERDEPEHNQAVTREQIEGALGKRNGAYQRLRRVMDAWLALWFWPLTDTDGAVPPTLEQWIDACQQLLGREPEARKNSRGMTPLGEGTNWDDLNAAEDLNLDFSGAVDTDEVLRKHSWLKVCEAVSAQQGFFHWELDFATVFARGGFDLQLGNPPWVKLETSADMLLAEGDPWWQLAGKASEEVRSEKRANTLAIPGIRELFIDGITDVVAAVEYLGSIHAYPLLAGLQPDLYRCFMEQVWSHVSPGGVAALIHLESHFTDERAGLLREHTYLRLRRHWQFINELMLYEIGHQKRYGVNIYGNRDSSVIFLTASSLYHPDTVERSMRHDGSGEEPGLKDSDGNWDLRPHRGRVISATDETLKIWHGIMEDDSVPVRQTRMVYTVNSTAAEVLETISRRPRVGTLNLRFSRGWDEARDHRRGFFESRWGVPESWDNVIMQGPHLYVATPIYKMPNQSRRNNLDWSAVDLEKIEADGIPATSYQPCGLRARYDASYAHWDDVPAREYYRIAWRRMAANVGERTLIPAIIPPGAAHVESVASGGFAFGGESRLCLLSGFLGSLIADFFIRSAPKSDIRASAVERLPVVTDHFLWPFLALRVLRVNCLSNAFADLWLRSYRIEFVKDEWAGGYARDNRQDLGAVTPKWSDGAPLRIAEDRRQALLEIDALVALMLGITADQLCAIYRTQFAVLYGYDHHSYVYDANGRLVPNEVLSVWRKKGEALTVDERTATNQARNTYTYELPFRLLDREADMRQAYAQFERRLAVIEGRDQ
jgi:hypothetical protein